MKNLATLLVVISISMLTLIGASAQAANSGITYQGRILKPDNTPLTGSNVQFRLQIRTPDTNNCLMYEEIQAQNMSTSKGSFSLTINDGTGVRNDSSGFGLDRIFANIGSFNFTPSTCSSGSGVYSPNDGDGRTLLVYFKDETMSGWEPMPPQKINYVPFAFESKQIQGFTAASLVRVQEADGSTGSIAPLSNANYNKLLDLIAGKLNGATLPTMTSGQVLGWNGTSWTSADPLASVQSFAKTALPTCTAGQFLRDSGSGLFTCATPSGTATGTVTSVATGTGLTGGPITTSGTIALATLNAGGTGFKVTYDTYGRVTAAVALVEADIPNLITGGKVSGSAITGGTIGGATMMNTSGSIITTGALTAGSITTSGALNAGAIAGSSVTATSGSFTTVAAKNVEIYETANQYKVTLKVPAGVNPGYDLTLPATAGANGKILGTTGAGVLAWVDPSSASQWANGSAGAISYSGGNVGIGTTTPLSALHVNENSTSSSVPFHVLQPNLGPTSTVSMMIGRYRSSQEVAQIGYTHNGGSTSTLNFGHWDNQKAMVLRGDGRLGIGTTTPLQLLDVAGGIRIGDTTACDGTTTGSIRYNGGNLQFCNGTWQTLGVSGAGITTLTGDVTSTGAPTATTTIAANAVTSAKILDGTIATADLSAGAVTDTKIANFSIDSYHVKGNALDLDRIKPIAASRLLGRDSTGAGSISQIQLGTGLAMTAGGVLNVTVTDSFAALPCADGYVPFKASGAWTCALATAAGTVDAIVKRDTAGSFVSAGATFTNSLKLKDGTAGGEVTLASPTGFTSYGLTLPTTAGTAGYVLSTNGSGTLSWLNPATASGASQWTTTGSDIYYSTGKVGIGTNTPTQALDVNGSISIGGKVISPFLSGLAVPGYLNFGGAELTGSNQAGSSFITFVGAGKSGTIGFDNAGATNRIRIGGYDSATPASQGITSQSVIGGTTDVAGADFSIDGSAGTGTGVGGKILFRTSPAGSTGSSQNARVTAMSILGNGTVGIGVTNPTATLDVLGNVNASTQMSVGSTGTNGSFNLRSNSGSLAGYVLGLNSELQIGSVTPSNPIVFSAHNGTALAERMRLTGDGKLGIGTTGPAVALHVVGSDASNGVFTAQTNASASYVGAFNVLAPNLTSGQNVQFKIGRALTGNQAAEFNYRYHSSTPVFSLGMYGTPDIISYLGNGNVGIGTTAPATGERLNVTGGAIVAGPQGTAVNSAGELRFKELAAGGSNYVGFRSPDGLTADTIWTLPTGLGTNGQVLTTNASGVLSWTTPPASGTSQWTTAGSDIYYSTGKVGVGTSTPAAPLDVVGDIRSSTAVYAPIAYFNLNRSATGTAAAPSYSFVYSDDSGMFEAGGAGSHALGFTTAGAERVRITNTGSVGIGSTSPTAKLDINGDVNIKGVKGISYPSQETTVGATIAIGPQTLSNLSSTSGNYANIAFGASALNQVTTGGYNLAIGTNAMSFGPSTGSNNVAVGHGAGQYMYSGSSNNTAIGNSAMYGNTAGGIDNTAVGLSAIGNSTNGGSRNTGIGAYAGRSIAKSASGTGDNNTFVGWAAGYDVSTGSNNIVVGTYSTGTGVTTGSNNILIGTDIRAPSNTASNQLSIGNLIYATGLATGPTLSTGNVGIGTTAPGQKLSVAGIIESTSGGVKFPDGSVQTTAGGSAYEVSCAYTGTYNCCQLNVSTGSATCKSAANSAGAWTTFTNAPFSSTTAGIYSISCHADGSGNLVCSRINKGTGATQVVFAPSPTGSWTAFSNNPF